MTSTLGLIKKLKKIEKYCEKHPEIRKEITDYILSFGEPISKQDTIDFINNFEDVKKRINNSG